MAALLDAPAGTDYDRRVEQADDEMDNLRGAFGWSIETGDIGRALELASSLQPLSRGRIQEGLAWFGAVFTDDRASLGGVEPRCARGLPSSLRRECGVVDGRGDHLRAARAW